MTEKQARAEDSTNLRSTEAVWFSQSSKKMKGKEENRLADRQKCTRNREYQDGQWAGLPGQEYEMGKGDPQNLDVQDQDQQGQQVDEVIVDLIRRLHLFKAR